MTKMGELLLEFLKKPEDWSLYSYPDRTSIGSKLLTHKPSKWVFEFTDEEHTDVPQYPCLSAEDKKILFPLGVAIYESLKIPFGHRDGSHSYFVSKIEKEKNQDHVFSSIMRIIMHVGPSK